MGALDTLAQALLAYLAGETGADTLRNFTRLVVATPDERKATVAAALEAYRLPIRADIDSIADRAAERKKALETALSDVDAAEKLASSQDTAEIGVAR